MTEMKAVVSPQDIGTHNKVTTTAAGERVVLVPMSEWKQCMQRGVRSAMQAFISMLPVGAASYLGGLGFPTASLVNLPSTGTPLFDAALYALVFGVLVTLWNMIEFALDVDLMAPKWRA